MAMIDEEALGSMLGDAAARIEIPDGAAERILVASRAGTPKARTPRPRLTVRGGSRGRRILVAAAAILVVGGVSLSLVTSKSSSNRGSVAGPEFVGPGVGASAPTESGAGESGPVHSNTGTAAPPSSGSAAPANSVPPLPSGSVGQSAKVEANGSISLTIGDGKLQAVMASLTYLAAGKGGFVASSQAQVGSAGAGNGAIPSSGTIVLRVPESSFATVVSQVQRFGHATSVTTTSTDVTGQYVDLQARITALEASRQQYLTIMSQATSIGDILAVQSQLDTLQSQIEQLQGQLSVLDNETTYGTLTVTLSKPATGRRRPAGPYGTGQGVARRGRRIRLGGGVAHPHRRDHVVHPALPGRAARCRQMGVAGVPPPDALRTNAPPPDALRRDARRTVRPVVGTSGAVPPWWRRVPPRGARWSRRR